MYLLVTARGGSRLQASEDKPDGGHDVDPGPRMPRLDKQGFPQVAPGEGLTSLRNGAFRFAASGWSMEQLASMIQVRLRAEGKAERLVVNGTGLTGRYDFRLTWVSGSSVSGDGPALTEALESQLGLKLEQRQMPADVVVIDHVARLPTAN